LAAVFGIFLGIDASIFTDLFAIFAIEGAFAIFADLAIFAFCTAFAAVIRAGFGIDALVAAIDLHTLAIRHTLCIFAI
jgi:hypothetical protein